MYDIAIIGLGPAGATAARLLDKRFRVIAIDKKSAADPAAFQKPCGGLLAGDAQKALSKFNLTVPKSILVDPQIFAVKTLDAKQMLLRYYQRFYINLDRNKFDLWLVSLIPEHVRIEDNAACTAVRRTDDGYEISYWKDHQQHTVTARQIIGADGSYSVVRRALFPEREIRRYLSIQQWFPERHNTPFYSCIFDADLTDAYCWSISKDGFFILGGAFPPKEAKRRFEQLKEKLSQQQGYLLSTPVKTEACLVSMPKGPQSFCTARDGAFMLGEAAGFISPSSLEGISYALDSAYTLAQVLNAGGADPARRYRVKTLPMRFKLSLKFLKAPFMYHPLLRKLVMKSGLTSISVAEP